MVLFTGLSFVAMQSFLYGDKFIKNGMNKNMVVEMSLELFCWPAIVWGYVYPGKHRYRDVLNSIVDNKGEGEKITNKSKRT